jgi:hypothetical protein
LVVFFRSGRLPGRFEPSGRPVFFFICFLDAKHLHLSDQSSLLPSLEIVQMFPGEIFMQAIQLILKGHRRSFHETHPVTFQNTHKPLPWLARQTSQAFAS